VHDIIDEEISNGRSSANILIAGASQGGALALYSGLTYNKPLAGILAISTYLPLSKSFPEIFNQENVNTPILMLHGEDDNIVRFEWGKESYELIKTFHQKAKFKSYPGVGHSSNTEEILDMHFL